jgi:hypothetical protein
MGRKYTKLKSQKAAGSSLSGTKVMICIPSYDYKVYIHTMVSLIFNLQALGAAGVKAAFENACGGCYVDRNRNILVNKFLASDSTHLLFWDADVAVREPDAILRLLEHRRSVVGGAYPYREQRTEGFPMLFARNEKGIPLGDAERGLLLCEHLPTGFLLIERSVFDIIRQKRPDDIDEKGHFQYFKTGLLVPGVKQWFGEDVYFCNECLTLGIMVWCDPFFTMSHIGLAEKTGSLDEWIKTHSAKEEG